MSKDQRSFFARKVDTRAGKLSEAAPKLQRTKGDVWAPGTRGSPQPCSFGAASDSLPAHTLRCAKVWNEGLCVHRSFVQIDFFEIVWLPMRMRFVISNHFILQLDYFLFYFDHNFKLFSCLLCCSWTSDVWIAHDNFSEHFVQILSQPWNMI